MQHFFISDQVALFLHFQAIKLSSNLLVSKLFKFTSVSMTSENEFIDLQLFLVQRRFPPLFVIVSSLLVHSLVDIPAINLPSSRISSLGSKPPLKAHIFDSQQLQYFKCAIFPNQLMLTALYCSREPRYLICIKDHGHGIFWNLLQILQHHTAHLKLQMLTVSYRSSHHKCQYGTSQRNHT
mgnify:CR=1 FL=1